MTIARASHALDGMRIKHGETLVVLFAMVVLILTVACASIASLLVARATARRREMAVRISLGAGRLRVVKQLLTESVLLAVIGGAAGVALSIAGMRSLGALLAAGFEDATLRAGLNGSVLAFRLP